MSVLVPAVLLFTLAVDATDKIPVALALKLSTMTSGAQLMEDIASSQENITMAKLVQEETIERKAAVMPEPAACMPEKQTIKLQKATSHDEWYFPSCTRIERCGGCCSRDDMLSCQPTEVQLVNFQVHVLKYFGGGKLSVKGKEIITVEKHIRCKCDCIRKPEDCNSLQAYKKEDCDCVCTNSDEKEKCLYGDQQLKSWDPDSCTCRCNRIRECNTGFFFNKHSCRCEPEQRPRVRFGDSYSTNTRVTLAKKDGYSIW